MVFRVLEDGSYQISIIIYTLYFMIQINISG